MKRIYLILTAILTFVILTSCTENTRAKAFGGTMTVNLETGQKLLEATWKESELWYLTRERREGEPIERYKFQEESSFGMMEGTVIFIEK